MHSFGAVTIGEIGSFVGTVYGAFFRHSQPAPRWANHQIMVSLGHVVSLMRMKLILACLAASPALAQIPGPFQPAAIYVVHSATLRTAQTPETGLAPGSLCDINVTGLYQPAGTLAPGDAVTLRFRAPGATDVRDLSILAAQPSLGGTPIQFTALVPADTPVGQAEILAVSASGAS